MHVTLARSKKEREGQHATSLHQKHDTTRYASSCTSIGGAQAAQPARPVQWTHEKGLMTERSEEAGASSHYDQMH
eukprot:5184164-Amphidinium_carterae.1